MLLTMIVVVLGVVPSHAESVIAEGTVLWEKTPGNPDHETVQYYLESCEGSHPNATFNAFIDVRAYEGKTLRFVPVDRNPPASWRLIDRRTCDYRFSETASTITTATEWVSKGDFLSISISFDPSGVRPGPFRYVLQECPCNT
jgi:hypothetical protein